MFLSAYARRFSVWGNTGDLQRAHFFARWLKENVSSGYHGVCWGHPFDWPNRHFFAPAGTPTIVNTAFIALAFLDYEDALQKQGLSSQDGLSVASSAATFMLNDLNRCVENEKELCLSYTPLDRRCVHNANVLGGWLISEVAKRQPGSFMGEYAMRIARFTVRHQRMDGAWLYGTSSSDNWIDNFHTGYVLTALKSIEENLGTHEFDSALYKGYHFWKYNFFLPDGAPKYYPHKLYPIDAHCAAQGILTFLAFRDFDPEAVEWAKKVADWTARNMQSRDGFFYYQILPRITNRIAYMRWTQAWMFKALTELEIYQGKFQPAPQ